MPIPKPKADETQAQFVGRCIAFERDAAPGRDSGQVSAICYQAWRDRFKEDGELLYEEQEPAIAKVYRDAGFEPPAGKGMHTLAFHTCAVQYLKKGLSRDEAYKRCMGGLGPDAAVRAEHRRESMEQDRQRLTEDVSFADAQFTEDNGARTIRNVVFLGGASKHGYGYKQEAMRKAVGLYNGVRCFINHPTREEEQTGRRDLMRLAGVTEAARHEDGKIKGTVKLLNDEYGQKFWNIAHTMPGAASCSHVADGKLVTEGGQKYVEEISEVLSVDLVVQGATTNTVFESVERKDETMDYTKITIEELRRLRPDLAKLLTEEGQKARDEEVKALTESNDKLKKQVDDFTVKEGQAKKLASVEKLLADSKLPKEAKTELFKEQLMKLAGDDFEKSAKALIEDRLSLLGGVKNMGANNQDAGGQTSQANTDSAVEAARVAIGV